MNARIPKPKFVGHYYIWQTDAYGESFYYADKPCDIYSSRPTPSTPSGDFIGHVSTVMLAMELLSLIDSLSPDEARRVVQEAIDK